MSSPTWDSVFTNWESTTFLYENVAPNPSNGLNIYRTANLTDRWVVKNGGSPFESELEVGGVVSAVLDVLSNSETTNINQLTTNAINLPQSTIEDISVTSGTSITGDSIILLKINGSTYRILADKI